MPERGLLERLAAQARDRGTHRAVVELDEHGEPVADLGHAALAARIDVLAARLRTAYPPGARLLLLYPSGVDFIVAFFATLAAGHVAVPLNPPRRQQKLERFEAVVADCGASAVLCSGALHAQALAAAPSLAGAGGLAWIETDALPPPDGAAPDFARWARPAADELAFVQYTSGSTGRPKGVCVSHGNLVANLDTQARRFGLGPDMVGVSWLPMFHDMGLIGGVLQTLSAGGTLVCMAPASFLQRPWLWWQAVSRYRATATAAPNFAFDYCVDRMPADTMAGLDLSSLRLVLNGAEPVQPATMARFTAFAAPAGFPPSAWAPVYGLAEATLYVAGVPRAGGPAVLHVDAAALEGHRAEPVAPGTPRARVLPAYAGSAPELECVLVAPGTARPVPDGEVGEICLRGEAVARGYWQAPADDDVGFGHWLDGRGGGFLRTGDLGFMRDGALYVTGRSKDLIVINGRNLYPQDIERCAEAAHPACRSGGAAAFAFGCDGVEQVALVQEVERGALRGFDADAVAAAVRRAVALAFGVTVAAVAFVKPMALPRTSSGKVQRSACRAQWRDGSLPVLAVAHAGAAGGSGRGPADEAERRVCDVWAEVFGHPVAADDDFFALGGHSLMATQIAVRLRERFGVAVPPLLVYEQPTVAAQARAIAALAGHGDAGDALVARRDDGPAPLSFSQERMWFFQQLDPGNAAYNLAAALRLRGPLDVPRLRRAFDALVARHPTLRAVVEARDGVPMQRVQPPQACAFEVVAPADADTLDARITAVRRPFELAHDAPLRVVLYAIAPQDHVLLLVCHHIAADQWTLGLLARELQAAYGGRPVAADDASQPAYADFCRWQRAWFPRERESLLAYWKQRLQGLQPLDLPYDRPRPALASFSGGTCRATLDDGLRAPVQRLAARHQATEYIVMLAALTALLHRLTGQHDIAVGAPIANRLHSAAERMVGSFVNTLVMRNQVHGGQRFGELLDAVRTTALQAYEHQSMPFEALVNALHPERDPSRSPLVQVFFNGMNAPMPPLAFDGLQAAPYPVDRRAAQFDLGVFVDFHFYRGLIVEYNDAVFERATVEALLARFLQCLRACVAQPDIRIDDLPLLLPGELERLAVAPNRTARPIAADAHVAACFARQVAAHPARTALVAGGEAFDYAALDALADAMARRIRARAPAPGRLVAVVLDRGPALLAALLGTLKAGCAYVPIDPEYPPERVRQMLEQAAPAVVLTTAAHAARHGFAAAQACLVDREPAPDGPPVAVPTAPDALAYVIFTSGSTGRPKGVPVTQQALANCVRAFADRLEIGADDRMAALTTVSFDIAALELFMPLACGARVVLLDRETAASPQRLAEAFDAEGVTRAQATPATWQMLLDAGWTGRAGLTVLCGGEALPPALRERLLPRVGALWNVYGPTETTIWSTAARLEAGDGPVSVGRPIDNTTVYVLDALGRPAPAGVTGELCIGGLGVSPGYLGRDDLTAERFVDWDGPAGPERLYRTGDLARWRADGSVTLVGRSDAQVKIRGYRVELGDVEAALAALPTVRQAVALAVGEGGGRQLVAYVAPAAGAAVDAPALRASLAERLPRFMLPSRIVAVDTMPLTPNGKVDRRALPPPPAELHRPASQAPRTPLEREMAGLWQAVLGVDGVGIDDNFFALGGHSLLAVQLVERIHRRFGARLPLATLFQAPTVQAMAARVGALLGGEPSASDELPAVVRIQPDGHHPVFFCAAGYGGNTLHLWDVAVKLGRHQPFFGLQPHGLMRGGTAPPASIEALAADYKRQIKAVQPHGPYYLGGFSGGGIDAYEVARQLRADGDEVALVVLFDSAADALVRGTAPTSAWRWLRALAAADLAAIRERLGARLATMRWPWLRRLKRWGLLPRRDGDDVIDAWLEHTRVGQAWLALARRYRPGRFDGRVTLFQIRDSEIRYGATNGWQAVVDQPVRVVRFQGSHVNFVRSPYSDCVAAALDAELAAARGDAAPPQAPPVCAAGEPALRA